MNSRFNCAVRVLVMLVLCPVLATAGQRASSDQETGPTGIACKDAATAMKQARFALSVGDVRLRDGKACIPTGIENSRCEWDVKLMRVEKWGTDGPLLAIVNATHDGPGAWTPCSSTRVATACSLRFTLAAICMALASRRQVARSS